MKKSINILILLVLISCQVQEKLETNPGTIKFSMQSVVRNEGGRITETPTPASVLISIEDESGNTVEDNKKLTLYSLGQGFVSESLQLIPGSYKLTQFLILNEDDGVIYATPQEGSELAEFVNDPLPIEFTISEDENTLVTPQVLAVHPEDTPESFGFASFGFEVVEPRLKSIKSHEYWGAIVEWNYSYENNLLMEINTKYCYPNEQVCTQNTTMAFEYYSTGELKRCNYVTDGTITSYYLNEYENNLLAKRTHYQLNNVPMETEYFYDQQGQLIFSKQRYTSAMTGYRLREFDYDTSENKVTINFYLVNGQGEKSLRLIDEFWFDDKKSFFSPIVHDIISYEGYTVENLISRRQTEVNISTQELYTCKTTIVYEYNALGLPAKATVSNPNDCSFDMSDGTILEFFYE
jgi:hypothetical protein